MSVTEGPTLPEFGNWINATDAAALYDRAHGTTTTTFTFREWLRDEAHQVRAFRTHKWEGRWMIDKTSMLDAFEEDARHLLEVVNWERSDWEGR